MSRVEVNFSSNHNLSHFILRQHAYVPGDVIGLFKQIGSVKPYIKATCSHDRFSMFVVCASSVRRFIPRDPCKRVVLCRTVRSQRRFFGRTWQVAKRILHGVCTLPARLFIVRIHSPIEIPAFKSTCRDRVRHKGPCETVPEVHWQVAGSGGTETGE